jgi:hypothetical protein
MLAGFEVEGFPTGEQLQWILSRFPYHESLLGELKRSLKQARIAKVEEDLSFDNFWNKYNYKVGNKKRAEKLWDQLSDADKAKVFTNINSYDNFLARRQNQEKLYPETYLSQRRFENSYAI